MESFKNYKHFEYYDLKFSEDDELDHEFSEYCIADDEHYYVPYRVLEPKNVPDADDWDVILSNELVTLGAERGEWVFIHTDF